MQRQSVAVLGATGTVGQKFITLLEEHPFFEVTELVASQRSAGRTYADACSWKQTVPIPDSVASRTVKSLNESLESRILFSGLDSSVAGEGEEAYASAGHLVISNSKNHRMDQFVPLVIPEINPDHFELVAKQSYSGGIITNSNCSTMFLAMALAPLHREFGVSRAFVSTLQAVSGAGFPGVPSMDILGNVVPYISGEEEKMEREAAKILGTVGQAGIEPAPFRVSAHCNRVPVYDGHTETLSVELERKADISEVTDVLASFEGMPQKRKLPSAPEHPIVITDEEDRPQPARDIWRERGMATVIGRIRECSIFDIKMVLLGHNTIRGAAGAAILNAEAFIDLGYLSP